MNTIDFSRIQATSFASFLPPAALPAAPAGPWMQGPEQLACAAWQSFLEGNSFPSAGSMQELLSSSGFPACGPQFQQAFHCATDVVRAHGGLPAYEELACSLPPGVEPPSRSEYYQIEGQLRSLGLSQSREAQVAVATLLGMGVGPAAIGEFLKGLAGESYVGQPGPCGQGPSGGNQTGGSSQPSAGGASQPSTGGPQPSAGCGSQPSAGGASQPGTGGCSQAPLPQDLSGLESEEGKVQQELSSAQSDVSAAQSKIAGKRTAKLNQIASGLPECDRVKFQEAQKAYTEAQARVAQLTAQQQAQQQAVAQTQSEIQVQTAKQAAARADVSTFAAEVASLNSQIGALTPSTDPKLQAAFESQKAALEGRKAAAQARLDEANRRLQEATTALAALGSRLATQQTNLETTGKSLTEQQAGVQTALAKMDALRGGKSTADDLANDPDVKAAQAELDAAQAHVSELQQRLSAVRQAITEQRVALQQQPPPSAGTLPEALVGKTGGKGSALESGVDATDGYNCWEASALYAEANEGQKVQLLKDDDGTNHAVSVSEDGNWVTFDGTHQVDPPVRLEDYLARSPERYDVFHKTDGSQVGPIAAVDLLDPARRATALEGIPAGAVFADATTDSQIYAGISITEWRNRLGSDATFQSLVATDSAGALRWLMTDPNLPGTTINERMQFILDLTNGHEGNGDHTHFALTFNDSGFQPVLQDAWKWDYSGNQVGHFLTAVDVGLTDQWWLTECSVGHEQYPDGSGFYQVVQCATGAISAAQATQLMDAIKLASDQTDLAQARAIIDAAVDNIEVNDKQGNSEQDMRLTAYGMFLGRIVGTFPDLDIQTLGHYMDAFVARPGQPTSAGMTTDPALAGTP